MASALDSPPDVATVGPFTGFGNFLRKEVLDWWYSWRLLLIIAVPTLIEVLTVYFGFTKFSQQIPARYLLSEPPSRETMATFMLVQLYSGVSPALFILVTIFATMGLLTREKTTGTLAWNLTKPLGRTGVFVAKWLTATVMLWVGMCVVPTIISTICMMSYHHVTPQFHLMIPIVGVAIAWIAMWVLLILAVSLAFESPAAVGGIGVAFWIVPFLFFQLLGEVFGLETRDWFLDRLATRSPFWAFPLTADESLFMVVRLEPWKEVWLWAYGITMVGLGTLSIRIFGRQEIGS